MSTKILDRRIIPRWVSLKGMALMRLKEKVHFKQKTVIFVDEIFVVLHCAYQCPLPTLHYNTPEPREESRDSHLFVYVKRKPTLQLNLSFNIYHEKLPLFLSITPSPFSGKFCLIGSLQHLPTSNIFLADYPLYMK